MRKIIPILILIVSIKLQVIGMCNLACDNLTTVSLDNACEYTVLYTDILEGSPMPPSCPGTFTVDVMDLNNNILPSSPTITSAFKGQQLQAIVTHFDPITGQSTSCFGYVQALDNSGPTLSCLSSLSLNLDNTGTVSITPQDIIGVSSDNCPNMVYNLSQTGFNCSHLGSNNVFLTVTDCGGNSISCFSSIDITDSSSNCVPVSFVLSGPLNSSNTYQALDFIELNAIIPNGISIILESQEVFTIDGFEVNLGGELEIKLN